MTDVLWQWDTCERISTALSGQAAVRALWLGGSLARDEADRFSDIDLVALIDDTPVTEAASDVEALAASEFELVLVRNRGNDHRRLLNFVTGDWIRFDLQLFSHDEIRRSGLGGMRLLFDKDGLDLPLVEGDPPTRAVTPEQVEFVVTEFIRVLGLLPVVLYRGDLVAAVSGSSLLREHLVTLLKYEQTGQTRTGALNDTASLTDTAAAAVLGLPALRAEEAAIVDFNRACWEVFVEYGPRIVALYQTEWPSSLAQAVRSRLARDLDVALN